MNKQVIATLNCPEEVLYFIVRAKFIFTAMFDNVLFMALTDKINTLGDDIKFLEDLATACKAVLPTASIEDRDAAKEVVKEDLRILCMAVQAIANKDPKNAVSIIKSAGMDVKGLSIRGIQQNTAQDGSEEGSVDLTAEGAGPHKWRMSLNDKDFTLLDPTMQAITTVKNLVLGIVHYFQNSRMLRNKKESKWSQSIKIRVR